MLQHLPGLLISLVDGLRTALIDHDVPCALTSLSYKRDVSQRLLHHPAEATTEESIDDEDIVRPLMVGYKDVGLSFVEQLASLYLHWQKHHPAHQSAPHHRWVVAPSLGFAKGAADDGDNGGQGCRAKDERQSNEQLIEAVEYQGES